MGLLAVAVCLSGLVVSATAMQLQASGHPLAGLLGMAVGLVCLVMIWLWWSCHRALLEALEDRGRGDWQRLLARLTGLPIESIHQQANRLTVLEDRLAQATVRIQLLQRQNHQTEAILHSLRDAVMVVDQANRVLLANRAAGDVFGFDWASARHQDIEQLLGPKAGQLIGLINQVRLGKNDRARMELGWSGQQGDSFYECVACCVRDQASQPYGAVVVLHDLTRDRQLTKAKDDFIGYVSHELKTPLASITAYAEMLLDGEVKDEATTRQFLKVIQDQAARLNQLVEDMLNTSRIESGLIPVDKRLISLAMLVEQQVRIIGGYAAERRITIDGQRPIVYDQVMADRDLMGMAIVNLLSNAIKYNSPGGSVSVRTEVDEVRSVVRVTITDTGVGIPVDQQARLFEKFYRAPANSNRAEGTGLGLSLVKQIVERLHGGKVFFRSQVGVGSTFGFELPLAGKEAQACRFVAMA